MDTVHTFTNRGIIFCSLVVVVVVVAPSTYCAALHFIVRVPGTHATLHYTTLLESQGGVDGGVVLLFDDEKTIVRLLERILQ